MTTTNPSYNRPPRADVIAVHDYRNGRFGTQRATFRRSPGGYRLFNGWSDPFFYRCPIEAKAAWRDLMGLLAQREAA